MKNLLKKYFYFSCKNLLKKLILKKFFLALNIEIIKKQKGSLFILRLSQIVVLY